VQKIAFDMNELWADVERDLIHNAIHQQMSAMLPIEVERQLTGRLGAWTTRIERLEDEVAALKAQMHRQIDVNSLFDATSFLHSRVVLPTTPARGLNSTSSPLSFESTSSTTLATTFNSSTNVELSSSRSPIAVTSSTTTVSSSPPVTSSSPPQVQIVSAVFEKTKQPCRASECHDTVSSFSPSAYAPHLRSQMHNFGTKSRTMTDRNGGVLFSDDRCECAGDHKFVSVPIHIDGNKLFEIDNCLECGKPRDTEVARACTQRLLALDQSAQVCTSAAGQKRAKRDTDNATPNRQQPIASVAHVANLYDAPPEQVIKVVRQPRHGDYPVCIVSVISSPGVCYLIRANNLIVAVRGRPADDKPFLIADVARLQRWMPHITHYNGQKLGVNAVPVAMHGFVDRFVVALCEVPRAGDNIDFDELYSLLMSNELVLCAGRLDGWYELRQQNELNERCVPLDMQLCSMFSGRVFDPSAASMFLASGELIECNVNETRGETSFPFAPQLPQLDDNDAVLLELMFKLEQWQHVKPRMVVAAPAIEFVNDDAEANELDAAVEEVVAANTADVVDMFLDAVHRNDVDRVRALIEAGVDVAARDSLALQIAAADGRLEIVRLFLADGRVDVKAFCGFPIIWAARGGHVDVVADLCGTMSELWIFAAAGFVLGGLSTIEAMLKDGRVHRDAIEFVIVLASLFGNLEIVERLLQDERVDPSALNNYAIRSAAEYGHLAVVDGLLQDKRVDPSARNNAAIRSAAKNGHLAVVDRLLQDGRVDPSALNNYAIRSAAENGHLAVVDRLLRDARVDPSAYNNGAIRDAAKNGHLAVIDRLLQDERVDPSAVYNKAIRSAAENGHLAVIDRLLQDERVDPSAVYNTAIRDAAENGHLAVVDRLLRDERVSPSAALIGFAAGGHVNHVERLLQDERVDPSADDNCAIRSAAENGHVAVVDRLLQDERVDPSADENRALRDAAENGHLAVVDRLLHDPRVDPSANDNFAIPSAGENGHLAVVDRLLQDPRVDPSANDNYAIQWTAWWGQLAAVNRLLQDKRVDPSADDNFAIRSAAKFGHRAVVNRLLRDERVSPSAALIGFSVQAPH
jgi:ankyrin repeat protein